MRMHAKLSPSGAYRWMKCPGSVRLEEGFPDTTSPYAAEGTLAHSVLEAVIKHRFPDNPKKKFNFNAEIEKLKKSEFWDPEMLEHANDAADFAAEKLKEDKNRIVMPEQRVDISRWVPDSFGTVDMPIVGGGVLTVADYKYGKGVPVSVEDNEQLMLYALGLYDLFSPVWDIQQIEMAILQPRCGGTSVHTISTEELLKFGEYAKERAEAALADNAETAAGEWCKFCKARQVCRTRADKNIQLAGFVKEKPETLTNEEIGEYLKKGSEVASWLADLQDYALAELLAGRAVEGWKAVEGRANRAWTDEDAAFKKILEAKLADEALLYNRKRITLAQTEKLLGKKVFNANLSEFVSTPKGKPALAEESDKRPAFKQVEVEKIFQKEN